MLETFGTFWPCLVILWFFLVACGFLHVVTLVLPMNQQDQRSHQTAPAKHGSPPFDARAKRDVRNFGSLRNLS